ncbi:L-threonylcarbamoyladenylate synthase, partial [Acinetobacter nectaris]
MLIFSAQEAANILHQGHTLAYPTEAVWGLGCDPMNEIAFHNILKLKQRPIEKGVILLASSIEQIAPLLENVSKEIQAQIVSSWSK